jgi:hypothetical protein
MNKITRVQFTIRLEDGSLVIRSFPIDVELPQDAAYLHVHYSIDQFYLRHLNTQVTRFHNNQ